LLLISSAVTAPARRAQQTFWILQPVFFWIKYLLDETISFFFVKNSCSWGDSLTDSN
jgi:hypothetical protein